MTKYHTRMVTVLTVLVAVMALCLAGCQPGTASIPQAANQLVTPADYAAYIRKEPAVRDVQLWQGPLLPGLVISTPHYRIYTTLLEPLMLSQVPSFVESAYLAYQTQLPQPLTSAYPFDIYLFGDRAEWEAFTKSFMGDEAELYLKIVKGAYTAKGVWVGYNIGRKQTFSVLGHEGWHQFNQRLFAYRLPSWLDEGIATLFETCRYTQGQFVFEPQRNLMRLGSLKQTMQQGGMIPLADLIRLNPGQVLNGQGDDAAVIAFYAQNYALVRFLREYDYGVYLRRYHSLLLDAAGGDWPLQGDLAAMAADRTRPLTAVWNMQISPALFRSYITEDLQMLEVEYRAFCGKITYRVRIK